MPEATVERNNSLLTGRNLWQNQNQEETSGRTRLRKGGHPPPPAGV